MLAFVIGSMLRLPLQGLAAVIKPLLPKSDEAVFLKDQNPTVRKMVGAIMTDGVLLARPALTDRLSLIQSDAAFHVGTGTALLVAAFVPGDASLRWLEAVLGIAMFVSGLGKGKDYSDQVLNIVGIGLADIIGGMTPQQVNIAKAVIKSLGPEATNTKAAQPIATAAEPPSLQKETTVREGSTG